MVLNCIFHCFPKLPCTYKRIPTNGFIFFHPLTPICLNPNLVFLNTILILNIHFFVCSIMLFEVTMASNKNKECPNCNWWISTHKGSFKHHIWSCQAKVIKFNCSEIDYSQSTNPLLSLSNDKQMPNIECNCDLHADLSSIQNCENKMSSMPDNASGVTCNFLDTNNFNGDDIKPTRRFETHTTSTKHGHE